MGSLIRRIHAIGGTLVLAGVVAGCGGSASPTAPTPLAGSVSAGGRQNAVFAPYATLDGTVQHDKGSDSWPLGGVLVEVIEGGVVTMTTTTDDNGNFHFELPPGDIQLRGSKRGYISRTTGVITTRPGQRTIWSFRIAPPVVLPAPPPVPYEQWILRTVSGRVTDALGYPVTPAIVCAVDADTNYAFACTGTDGTGAYTVQFRVPVAERRPAAALTVSRTGYRTQHVPLECCVSPDPMVVNVAMHMRVVSVMLIGPTTLAVGQAARITALVVFDDGSEVPMTPILFEVRGTIQNSPQGTGMIEAMRPGGGPVWWTYQNVTGGLTITVPP
jgi:hypothetical protein